MFLKLYLDTPKLLVLLSINLYSKKTHFSWLSILITCKNFHKFNFYLNEEMLFQVYVWWHCIDKTIHRKSYIFLEMICFNISLIQTLY